MQADRPNCLILSEPDNFGATMHTSADGGNVGREDRIKRVLDVLADSGCAMPPAVIFRNAKLRGADFERRSVNNYLTDLHERGLVIKVDPASLDDGDVVEIDISEEGYFMATDEAPDYLQG
jgi:repressor of nif and glnA expression